MAFNFVKYLPGYPALSVRRRLIIGEVVRHMDRDYTLPRAYNPWKLAREIENTSILMSCAEQSVTTTIWMVHMLHLMLSEDASAWREVLDQRNNHRVVLKRTLIRMLDRRRLTWADIIPDAEEREAFLTEGIAPPSLNTDIDIAKRVQAYRERERRRRLAESFTGRYGSKSEHANRGATDAIDDALRQTELHDPSRTPTIAGIWKAESEQLSDKNMSRYIDRMIDFYRQVSEIFRRADAGVIPAASLEGLTELALAWRRTYPRVPLGPAPRTFLNRASTHDAAVSHMLHMLSRWKRGAMAILVLSELRMFLEDRGLIEKRPRAKPPVRRYG